LIIQLLSTAASLNWSEATTPSTILVFIVGLSLDRSASEVYNMLFRTTVLAWG
jgi:hypothetical protein